MPADEVRKSNGQLKGHTMAEAGFVLGHLGVILGAILIALATLAIIIKLILFCIMHQ